MAPRFLHRLEFLEAPLGLGSAAAAHVAAYKLFFLADELLLPVVVVAQSFSMRSALFPVGAVIAAIDLQSTVLDFPDSRREIVDEGSVVADGEHGAGERRQELLQPFNRLNVQMIGRLVEN